MVNMKRYDGELQMFTEEAHSADKNHLAFYRYLRERGRIGHLPVLPSSGPHTEGVKEEPCAEPV